MNDPERIWGYVTLIDPTSGSYHLMRSFDDPHQVVGFPEPLDIVFVERSGLEFTLRIGQFCRQVGFRSDGSPVPNLNQGIGYYYSIALFHDTTETGNPRLLSSTPANGIDLKELVFNPEKWSYRRHSFPYYIFPAPDDRWMVPGAEIFTYSGRRFGRLPLQPTGTLPWRPLFTSQPSEALTGP